MTVTVASFREAFPEFSDPLKYPDAEINWWLSLGVILVDPNQWYDLTDYGVSLFVAHNLALEAAAAAQASGGGIPGSVVGPVTSASVDKVSYSRDASAAMDPKNGHWNLTTYGLRYIRLVGMVGAKPLSPGFSLDGTNFPGPAYWPGVIFPTTTP